MQLSLFPEPPIQVVPNFWNPGYHLCTISGDLTWRHGEQPGHFESVAAAVQWAQQRGVTPAVHPSCWRWTKKET